MVTCEGTGTLNTYWTRDGAKYGQGPMSTKMLQQYQEGTLRAEIHQFRPL